VEKCFTAGLPTDVTIIWRMRVARWISKATETHSEYVTLTDFPPQQRLQKLASMLRHKYIACIIFIMYEYTYIEMQD